VRCTTLQSTVLLSHVVSPSVCPSVTLVDHDHIGWKSGKLIARSILRTSSLVVVQRSSTYSRGTWRYFGEIRGGVGKKWCAGAQKRQYLWNALRHTHTHTQHTTVLLLCWNLSGTTRVSRYQKGKTRKVKIEESYYGGPIGSYQCSFECCRLRPPTSMTYSFTRLGFTTTTKTPIAIVSWTATAMHFKFSMHIQKLSGHSYIRCIARSSLR